MLVVDKTTSIKDLFDAYLHGRYHERASTGLGMSLTVYISSDIDPNLLLPVLQQRNLPLKKISKEILNDRSPKILVTDYGTLTSFENLPSEISAVLLVGANEDVIRKLKFPEDTVVDFCDASFSTQKFLNLIEVVNLKQQISQIRAERDNYFKRLKELNNIGVALTTERNLLKLGELILQKSREITSADAGSLYTVEGDEIKRLRFRISQNDSMEIDYEEFLMALTTESIAGYVAITGESLNIPDVYLLTPQQEYKFNRKFDESTGYRTTSTLAVPMKNTRGIVLGVIQLINRKNDYHAKVSRENFREVTRPFDRDDEDLVSSLASQAAVALENSRLIRSIETLFEGFVTASVTAIESRDPTTSGHSFRVADLTVGLAEIVDKSDSGHFREISFTADEIKEMRYAGLLHDFGKVGVREDVLVKAKKLYPLQLELIRERIAHYQRAWEAEYYKSKLNFLLVQGRDTFDAQHKTFDQAFKNRLNSLHDYLQFIEASNEPTVLPEGNFEKLLRIAEDNELVPPGVEYPILSSQEAQLLSIRKGSLNERERIEIESHVIHTFEFLSKIPWTSELKRIPEIAYGHHEKLNGSGYPNRMTEKNIPIQTRMMTISDIYDALTASDRPYKRAVAPDRALDILSSEVKSGQIDQNLFQIFLDAKVYLISSRK